jgi:AraC-like DNA-binding protein
VGSIPTAPTKLTRIASIYTESHPIADRIGGGSARRMEGTVSQFAGSYREWAPHASLRGHMRCLWINDLSESRTESLQVVPDGCVDIVLTGETLCIAGPDTRPTLARMPRGAIIVGARFHPGAASAWLGQPLSEIANVRVPLAEFWRDDATRFLDQAATVCSAKQLADDLEAFLVGKLPAIAPADQRVAFLRRAAGDNCTPAGLRLDQLAAHVGLSERTLRRRCVDAFGYGFKTLDRVLRFQRFFRLASRPEIHENDENHNLADIAARAGYADQAHMTREVRRMSGRTASEFVAQAQARAQAQAQTQAQRGLADSFKTTVAGRV